MLSVLVVMVAVLVSASAQNLSQKFNLQAKVSQYITVNPGNLVNEVNPVGAWNQTIVDPGDVDAHVLPGWPSWKVEYKDNVYANCPFTITYTGTSVGSSTFPILSRQEVNGNGFDRLQTYIVVRNEINGEWNNYLPGHESHDMKFISDAEGADNGTMTGSTLNFVETPHDGEVATTIWMSAALPHVTPEFGVDNTWNQSADAGLYTCEVNAVYAVMP